MSKKQKSFLRVPYCLAVYGKEEISAVNRVLANPVQLAPGHHVALFEKRIAKLFGKDHGVMVNSGSSANLMAVELLDLPAGAEVITPALTFATTVAPILQKRLAPVFTDVEEGSYVMNVDQIESVITPRTKAIMFPLLIGNVPDMEKIARIAKKHDLKIIEDSCDTLGATFDGKPTGAYSDISTTSFYASHIITAGGAGGMVMVHDNDMARRALVMSRWGRDSALFGAYDASEDLKKRFSAEIDGIPYDAKFVFSEIGYNFQPTEASAAFGLEQLKKLRTFAAYRNRVFKDLVRFFRSYEDLFILPRTDARVKTSWMTFPLTLRSSSPFTRRDITTYLEERNIQTRPLFAGNVTRQPAYRAAINKTKIPKIGFPVADHVMRHSFLIGCHQGLQREHLDHLKDAFTSFLHTYR